MRIKSAPRKIFICKYCGKEVERRLSKVRNPDLVFCDNHCRAKYAEKLAFIKKGLSHDNAAITAELNKMERVIGYCAIQGALRFGERYLEDFKQIGNITVWREYNRANNGKGKPESYYFAAIKRQIKNAMRKEVYSGIDDYYVVPDYSTPETELMQKEVIDKMLNGKATSIKILLSSCLQGLSHAEIAKKYNCTVRQVSYNIYNAKRMIGAI